MNSSRLWPTTWPVSSTLLTPWYAHDYVPFDEGRDFAFLGGDDWNPSQVKHAQGSDGSPRGAVDHQGQPGRLPPANWSSTSSEDKWGRWLGRWTAEENLHAIALRQYLMATCNIDPNADEEVRVKHVMRGYRASNYGQIETLVFMALWERAHVVYLTNLEAKISEPALKKLVGRILGDEKAAPGVLRQPRRAPAGDPSRSDHQQ